MDSPPVLWDIESDPCLAGTKIIAEAWDAVGLYQVGTFIGHRWAEWNGRYRDDVRRFWRGDTGTVVDFAARIIGSPDVYTAPDHALHRSINFITAHDGFTLNDLVSYNKKHNLPNGENNQDGADENYSCNYGHEGPTTDPEIEELRARQIKNALTTLLISQGTPMLLFGDEVRRTQRGNNNAYCQDNETNWLNWEGTAKHQGLLRFFRRLVQLNREHPILNLEMYALAPQAGQESSSTLECLFQGRAEEHITWHGIQVNKPDWGHHSHSIALTLHGREDDDNFHMMFNAYWKDLEFELPRCPNGSKWLRLVDTNQPSPQDIRDPGEEDPVEGSSYLVGARSVVILIAHRPDG